MAAAKKGAKCCVGCLHCHDLKMFILKTDFVGTAVGLTVGLAFSELVKAFVRDWVTPIIGIIIGPNCGKKASGGPAAPPPPPTTSSFGGCSFATLNFTVRGSVFNYGDFINQMISFLLICVVVFYFVVIPVNSLLKKLDPGRFAIVRPCPHCCTMIPEPASVCAFCTRDVPVIGSLAAEEDEEEEEVKPAAV